MSYVEDFVIICV